MTEQPLVGVQLYTVRSTLKQDRPAVLHQLAALGIDGVEPFGLGDPGLTHAQRTVNARRLRADIDGAGLSVSSTHTYLPDPVLSDWLFDEIAEVGAPVAVAAVPESVLGFPRDSLLEVDSISRYADRLNRIAAAAATHGIRIGYHNHSFEWAEVDQRPGYERLFDLLDPAILAEVDLYWAQTAGQVPAEVVTRLGARVELVHVKDGPAVVGAPQVPAGSGEVALDAALTVGSSIKWHILELDDVAPGVDVIDTVAAGVAWLAARQ